MNGRKAGRHSAAARRKRGGQSSSGPDSGELGRLEGGLPKAARSQSARSGPSVTRTKTMMIRATFMGRAGTEASRRRGVAGKANHNGEFDLYI